MGKEKGAGIGVLVASGIVALGPLAGCARFEARLDLKRGNAAYRETKYARAIEAYERVPQDVPERVAAALNTGYAHLAQYRFGSRHPVDREHAEKAVEAFEEYLRIRPPEDQHATPEKIDEFIITLLVDAEQYERAIERLEADLAAKPDDPAILQGIASTYDKWNRPILALQYFQKWAALFPDDPAPWEAIAAYCWNMSYRQGYLMESLQRNRWVDHGLAASDVAVRIKPELVGAITYKNLLLRERAKLRVDPDEVAALMNEARVLLERAKELRDKQKQEQEAAKAAASPAPGGA